MTNKSISLLMESLVGNNKKVVFPCDGAEFGSECLHETQQAPWSLSTLSLVFCNFLRQQHKSVQVFFR